MYETLSALNLLNAQGLDVNLTTPSLPLVTFKRTKSLELTYISHGTARLSDSDFTERDNMCHKCLMIVATEALYLVN